MTKNLTASAIIYRFALWALREAGKDGDEIFRSVGIEPDELDKPNARVLIENGNHLWREIESQMSKDFGLKTAKTIFASQNDLVWHLVMGGKTLMDFLRLTKKYTIGYTEFWRSNIEIRKDYIRWELIPPPGTRDIPRMYQEWTVAASLELMRQFARETFPVKDIAFWSPRFDEDIGYLEDHFDAPIRFGARGLAITIDSKFGKLPNANPRMEESLLSLLEQVWEDSWHTQISAPPTTIDQQAILVVKDFLPGRAPSVHIVANELAMSSRSLQRKLGEQNLTFSKLVDQVRWDVATTSLMAGTEIKEVAVQAGYENLSSFYRAFKRWTGHTPGVVRDK